MISLFYVHIAQIGALRFSLRSWWPGGLDDDGGAEVGHRPCWLVGYRGRRHLVDAGRATRQGACEGVERVHGDS
jgi:hypothetical protein